jgi:hypothetical protein
LWKQSKKKLTKKALSETHNQLGSTNQTHDLWYEIEMSIEIGKQKHTIKKILKKYFKKRRKLTQANPSDLLSGL